MPLRSRSSGLRSRGLLAGVQAQRANVSEGDLVVDRLFYLHASDLGDAIAELHAGGAMPLGDLAIVPERQCESRSFLREKQQPLETVRRAKPTNHLLRDDRRIPRRLSRSSHTREAYVHVDSPFPSRLRPVVVRPVTSSSQPARAVGQVRAMSTAVMASDNASGMKGTTVNL